MEDASDNIPIDADDLEIICDELNDIEEEAKAALWQVKNLREEIAEVLGIDTFDWRKAPRNIQDALRDIEEAFETIETNANHAARKACSALVASYTEDEA